MGFRGQLLILQVGDQNFATQGQNWNLRSIQTNLAEESGSEITIPEPLLITAYTSLGPVFEVQDSRFEFIIETQVFADQKSVSSFGLRS